MLGEFLKKFMQMPEEKGIVPTSQRLTSVNEIPSEIEDLREIGYRVVGVKRSITHEREVSRISDGVYRFTKRDIITDTYKLR